MDYQNCTECRIQRVFVDGKCKVCGYISSQRQSIEFLYPSKANVGNVKQSKKASALSNRHQNYSNHDISSSMIASYVASDSSCDSGSSGGSCDF